MFRNISKSDQEKEKLLKLEKAFLKVAKNNEVKDIIICMSILIVKIMHETNKHNGNLEVVSKILDNMKDAVLDDLKTLGWK